MASDFSAKQIRVSQLMASGGISGTGAGLLIYSASDASDYIGGFPADLVASFGNDVFLFVSGTKDGRSTGAGDVTLFGGDVVVSGTLYAEKQVVEVNESTTGSFSVSGSFFVSQSATINQGLVVNESAGIHADDDFRVETGNKTHAVFVDASTDQVLILSGGGGTSTDESGFSDTSFFVSGTVGSRGTAVKGTALFGGDLHVSGAITSNGTALVDGTGAANRVAYWSDTDTLTSDTGFTWDGSTFTANGAMAIDTSTLVVDSSTNRVGIGTASPDGNLHVQASSAGTVTVTGDQANGIIIEDDDSTAITLLDPSGGVIYFGDADDTDIGRIGYRHSGDYANSMYFYTNNAQQMTIDSAGNVGIGTNSPSGILDVKGDGSTSQIFLLSGSGAAADPNEAAYADMALFVSGAIGSRGTTTKGTAIFGGDVVISGSLYGGSPLSIGDGITVDGSTVFNEGGVATADFRVESDGEDEALFIDSSENKLYINKGNTSFITTIGGAGTAEALRVNAGGVVLNIDGHTANDFRVETSGKENAIFVDAGTDQVLILSGGGGTSTDESDYADMAFFVSGAVGSRGTTVKGTSIFGGDTVISGALYLDERAAPGTIPDGTIAVYGKDDSGVTKLYFKNESGEVELGVDGAPGGSDTQLQYNNSTAFGGISGATTDGSAVTFSDTGILVGQYITHDGDPNTQIRFETDEIRLETGGVDYIKTKASETAITLNPDNAVINTLIYSQNKTGIAVAGATDQVLILSGGGVNSYDEAKAADVNFYVSGTVGSAGTAIRGTSVFGGDVVISGSLYGGTPLEIGDGLTVNGITVFNEAGSATSDFRIESDNQAYMFQVDSSADRIGIGTNTFTSDVTLDIRGDVATSGYISASMGFSGSLTRLVDGTSYLAAGSNVTITSASNGQVTIASTGGGGSPGGSDTQVQYNNGGSFGGVADLTFNDSTGDVTVGTSTGDAKLFFRDAGNYIYSNADGDFDIINTDGTAANSILIDCNAGGVTIDGHTGVTLVAPAGAVDIDADSGTLSLDGSAGINIGTGGAVAVDFNANTLDIDALLAVTIDSAGGTIGIGTDDNDFNISIGTQGGRVIALGSSDAGIDIDAGASGVDIDSGTGGFDVLTTGELALSSSMNSGVAIQLHASAGGMDIRAAGAPGEDIYIVNAAGSLKLIAEENANDAIEISAIPGGVIINAGDTANGIQIGGSTSGVPIKIGHTTSETTVNDNLNVTGNLLPSADVTSDLGSETKRWQNIYTGDLHLANERGDWSVIEESDYLTLRNNKSGKRYKLLMELLPDEGEE